MPVYLTQRFDIGDLCCFGGDLSSPLVQVSDGKRDIFSVGLKPYVKQITQ